jgi:hypothetical protein
VVVREPAEIQYDIKWLHIFISFSAAEEILQFHWVRLTVLRDKTKYGYSHMWISIFCLRRRFRFCMWKELGRKIGEQKPNGCTDLCALGYKHYSWASFRFMTYRAFSLAVPLGDVVCERKRNGSFVRALSKTLVCVRFIDCICFITTATNLYSVSCFWDFVSLQAL